MIVKLMLTTWDDSGTDQLAQYLADGYVVIANAVSEGNWYLILHKPVS